MTEVTPDCDTYPPTKKEDASTKYSTCKGF